MIIQLLVILILCVNISPAIAASVRLNDGREVKGTIVEQTAQAIRVEVGGAVMTYFADEVKDVDGQPMGVAVKPQAVSQTVPLKAIVPNEVSVEKRALILEFMSVFGSKEALRLNFDRMLAQASEEKPEMAQKIKDRVKVDEIIDELIPVYDRNFSAQELKAFIAFYSSAAGKKLIATIPLMMKDSVEVSVRYMQRKFPELADQ